MCMRNTHLTGWANMQFSCLCPGVSLWLKMMSNGCQTATCLGPTKKAILDSGKQHEGSSSCSTSSWVQPGSKQKQATVFLSRTLTGNLVEGEERGELQPQPELWKIPKGSCCCQYFLLTGYYVFLNKENWGRTQTPQAHTEVSYEYRLLLF